MSEDELVDYLEDRAAKYHRGTVHYDGDSTDVLHLRDDLKEKWGMGEIDRMLTRLRPESSPDEARAFPYGDLRATVRLFDEAIILHFPTGPNRGVVVALEPETATDLDTFVGECHKRIRG